MVTKSCDGAIQDGIPPHFSSAYVTLPPRCALWVKANLFPFYITGNGPPGPGAGGTSKSDDTQQNSSFPCMAIRDLFSFPLVSQLVPRHMSADPYSLAPVSARTWP